MSPKQQFNRDARYVLNKIDAKSMYAGKNGIIKYEIDPDEMIADAPQPDNEEMVLHRLRDLGAVRIINYGRDYINEGIGRSFYKVLELKKGPKFNYWYRYYNDVLKQKDVFTIKKREKQQTIKRSTLRKAAIDGKFTISVRDREIRVNSFVLSRPHVAGPNMIFFEHIYQNPNELITREKMPVSVQNAVRGTPLNKIINELGFRGEILKAFVPKRSKNSIVFRKEVSKSQLAKEGINILLLEKELESTHIGNNPK